jgi:hypothetical protein
MMEDRKIKKAEKMTRGRGGGERHFLITSVLTHLSMAVPLG